MGRRVGTLRLESQVGTGHFRPSSVRKSLAINGSVLRSGEVVRVWGGLASQPHL